MAASEAATLSNFVNGQWVRSSSSDSLPVLNPATGDTLARVPLSTSAEVDAAVAAAAEAFLSWRETPVVERARYLFRLRDLMAAEREEFARTISAEEGKSWPDALGEVQRAIENVEVAAGMPSLMMGSSLEDIARGIDESIVRQPLGVFAGVVPFNFPLMVPCWFFPYAIATGCTYILKPSEQVPLASDRLFHLVEQIGLPPGVLNLVHGAGDTVQALLEHPGVRGISFVGSSRVAKYIYTEGTKHGKRVQASGGAKNYIIVMPDAPRKAAVEGIINSAFGAAGERCLAGSVVVPVGPGAHPVIEDVVQAASRMKMGPPSDQTVELGPLISEPHLQRVVGYIDQAVDQGARLLLDGRRAPAADMPGCFLGPTVVDQVDKDSSIMKDEVFGPVLCVLPAATFEEAIDLVNASELGNAASIFTTNGRYAREFRHRVEAGNIGVNVGVPAPMAFFSFGGMKGSFYGDLHPQGRDVIDFFTDRKVIIERWPSA
jgi:malonate-semialdehyde dehydrogenase (acetylating)/methylmalonate-semialdehyde dehydrogenase